MFAVAPWTTPPTTTTTPTPLHILLSPSPPLLHLLLSNCLRNHSFISITCRKCMQPKITPIPLRAFLYRPIFPVPFSLESLLPLPCLFLKTSFAHVQHFPKQCFKNSFFHHLLKNNKSVFRGSCSIQA